MRLYIPSLRTRLTTAKDWTFTLHNEHRNSSVFEMFDPKPYEPKEGRLTREEISHYQQSDWQRNVVELGEDGTKRAIKRRTADEPWMMRGWGPSEYEDVPAFKCQWEERAHVEKVQTTIPAGTVLSVDRIYIRKGQDGYDSITFTVVSSSDPRFVSKSRKGLIAGPVRFWVKLADANKLEIEEPPPDADEAEGDDDEDDDDEEEESAA